MVKYDENFKQRVVDAYLAGEGGYLSIAKRFGIPSTRSIMKWVNAYEKYGKDGLIIKKSYTTYSVQFKLDVLNYKVRTGESYQQVALKFGIPDRSTVARWLKKWQQEGAEGIISKPKGRPPMSNEPKKKNTAEKMTNEQQLKRENELLRAENAYLKKLRASGINIPNRLLKRNQESSTNSEKSSN